MQPLSTVEEDSNGRHHFDWLQRAVREQNVFIFLLGTRWLALLPPLLALSLGTTPDRRAIPVGALALGETLLLTAFSIPLNRMVRRKPIWFALDIGFGALFIALTGGYASPYGLYILTPLLAAAFFFELRGAVLGCALYVPLFCAAVVVGARMSGHPLEPVPSLDEMLRAIISSLICGFASLLLRRTQAASAQLQSVNAELSRAETQAALGKTIGYISHEIRNPLATLGGHTRRILRHPEDVEAVRRHAAITVEEVERLEHLLTDLLDLSRPRQTQRKPVLVSSLLDRAWELAGGELLAPGLRLETRYEASLPPVPVDESAMVRAFLNVITNAIQFMPQGGTLTITTRRAGDMAVITISDTGPGIPPQVLPTIFEEFVSHRERGTGLGLAVAQQVVQEHGGRIEAQSEPGRGATFIFYLRLEG